MTDAESGNSTAIVAIVAIIVILAVGFFLYRAFPMTPADNDGTSIDVNLPVGGGTASTGNY